MVSHLGQGGFGIVFWAKDKKLNRDVAIKVLRDGLSEEAEDRFVREAQICSRLRHPNIITIYDASVARRQAYIVMEKLEAKDLGSVIGQEEPNVKKAIDIIRQVASALSYLHSESVLHRDVKPQNVMLDVEGRAILMDFNLGLDLERTALTNTGVVVGTPRYMAPEVIQGLGYSEATEVYALGALFHNLLSGQLGSFQGIEGVEYEAPSQFNKKVTPELDEIVAWMTAASPKERCKSVDEFIRRIEKNEKTQCVPAVPLTVTLEPRHSRLGIVGIVILLVICLLFLSNRDSPITVTKYGIEVSPLKDGCYARLIGFKGDRPQWRLLQDHLVLARGKTSASGNGWIADVKIRSSAKSLRIQFVDGGKLIAQRSFVLSDGPFEEKCKARAGKNTVQLSWKLRVDEPLQVRGIIRGVSDKQVKLIAKDKVLVHCPNALSFDYVLALGDRVLVRHKVKLGCVERYPTSTYPDGLPWKLGGGAYVLWEKSIISTTGKDELVSLAIERNSAGPRFVHQFTVDRELCGKAVELFLAGNGRCGVISKEDKSVKLLELDIRKRIAAWPKQRKSLLPSEHSIELGPYDLAISKCQSVAFDHTKRLIGVLSSDRKLFLFTKRDQTVQEQEFSFLDVEDFSLFSFKEMILLVTASSSSVKMMSFVSERKSLLLKQNGTKVIEAPADVNLRMISQNSDLGFVREVEVNPLSQNMVVLRCGKRVCFIKRGNNKWQQMGPLIDLPCNMQKRVSQPMPIGGNKVVYGIVKKADNPIAKTQLDLLVLQIRESASQVVEGKKLAHSLVASGRNAICGRVGSDDNYYYLPALEHVFVISKRDGQVVDRYLCDWRPNLALPVDGTLFVPLNCRKVLGVDLIDR